MKAAGVGKYKLFRQYNYAQVPHGEEELQKSKNLGIECVNIRNCKDEDNTCIYWYELHYPVFTPEKQLELIKLIASTKKVECFYIQLVKEGFKISCLIDTGNIPSAINATDPVSDNALAQLVSNLIVRNWIDKSEVRRILEDD